MARERRAGRAAPLTCARSAAAVCAIACARSTSVIIRARST
jgi:hypothetical protein